MEAEMRHLGRKAFVTGGSGFVGRRLIAALIKHGWQVNAIARSPEAVAIVKELGAFPIEGELNDASALEKGMSGCEVVFHAAAYFKMWGMRKDFDAVNVDGMRQLLKVAQLTSSIRRVVFVSAAAVVMGAPVPMIKVDEQAPLQMPDFASYSASKAEAEKILLEANGCRQGFETISIRPPFIWGAGMPTLDTMVQTVKSGQWRWVDNGVQLMSHCHVDNVVDALLLAIDNGLGGQAYFVTDAEEGTVKSVIGGLFLTRRVALPNNSVPFNIAWAVAGLMALIWNVLGLKGEPPITRQLLRLIGKPFTVCIDKARRDLGYTPRISWTKGIADMTSGELPPHLV